MPLDVIRRLVAQDVLLTVLLLSAAGLYALHPQSPDALLKAVPWPTMAVLTGFVVLVQLLEFSGSVEVLASQLVRWVNNARGLYLVFTGLSLWLAMWLTNDITLLIVLPITLHTCKLLHWESRDLLILEALAVNIGSMWTPVGNPQNIVLWQAYHPGFLHFMAMMTPLVAGLLLLLLLTIYCIAPDKCRPSHRTSAPQLKSHWPLIAVGYLLFLGCAEWQHPFAGLGIVVLLLLWRREDWKSLNLQLLLIFLLMFIDMRLLQQCSAIAARLPYMTASRITTFFCSLGLSQLLSNVPTTLLLLPQHPPLSAFSYGVNVGGFGLATGSLANLIMLRWPGVPPGLWRRFHLFSLGFMLIATLYAVSLLSSLRA